MKVKDKMRLAELKSKDPADLTDDEKKLLAKLEKRAKDAGLNVAEIVKQFSDDEDDEDEDDEEDEDEDDDDDSKGVSDEELTKLITKAVAKATDGTSVDTDKLIDEIKSLHEGGLTIEDVEKVMKKHVGGTSIDKDALLEEIKGMIPNESAFEKRLTKALSKFAAQVTKQSRNQFAAQDDSTRDFPFEHRENNMTVAEKQLLNLCVSRVSESSKRDMIEKGVDLPSPDDMNHGISDDQLAYARKRGQAHAKASRHAVLYGGKALTTTGVGSGAELVPTDLSSDLQARMYLESQLAAELMAAEIDMPTNPFQFPLTTTRTNFYVGTENPGSDPTNSEPGTANITLDAKKLIGVSEYSYESDEDAIFAILPFLQARLGTGAADAFEGALINGDDSATHQDTDIHAVPAHHAKLFKGFRKYALDGGLDKDLSSGGINATNIAAMRKDMKHWGIRPRDLMLIVGPQGYNDLVTLDETLTFEKVGSQAAARILTGEAASIYGIRIVVSSQIREDLEADGMYDGVNADKGSILLVHRPSFITGVKRGFTVEIEQNKLRQMNQVIASFRRAFVPQETPSATIPTVVLGRNFDAA